MRLVACHDAGGAEVVSSYLRRRGESQFLAVLEGPALSVFARKFDALELCTLEGALGRAQSLLCGSSWQSRLEFDALERARTAGLHSVAFLDHWVNYAERFCRDGRRVLPDEFLVTDDVALARAREAFPGIRVREVGNPYLEDLTEQLSALRPAEPDAGVATLLFLSEPVSEHERIRSGDPRNLGYDEHEALAFLMARVERLGEDIAAILIRPHPSEDPAKYAWALREHGVPVRMGGDRPLLEEVAACRVVAGMESMAMVVALRAGKRVLCCIPPAGRPCVLPFGQIERLPA
jgi:hypothetical protein